jgi:hypothetical protein
VRAFITFFFSHFLFGFCRHLPLVGALLVASFLLAR